jgi:mono/diheme cytochrome c family protein
MKLALAPALGTSVVLAGALLLACRALEARQPADSAEVARVLDTFREACTACHVPPDPRFAAERAWLARLDATG